MSSAEPVELLAKSSPFVGRGALKLEGALDRFQVVVDQRRALDAGSSTGGFTDALLQRGAAHVIAVDVGYGQIHERLRDHPKVDVRERTNIRHVTPADISAPVDVVVADLSFISLRVVAPALTELVAIGGDMIMLVKPQFEAGRREASKGKGVIRQPEVWRRVIGEVQESYIDRGVDMMGLMVSPLRGADGNVEFLLHGRRSSTSTEPSMVGQALPAEVVEAVVAEAAEAKP